MWQLSQILRSCFGEGTSLAEPRRLEAVEPLFDQGREVRARLEAPKLRGSVLMAFAGPGLPQVRDPENIQILHRL